MPRYQHLIVPHQAQTARYTARRGRSPEFRTPSRNRGPHARNLLRSLNHAATTHSAGFPKNVGSGFYESPGVTLSFQSTPNFPLAFESLDLQSSGIKLLSVTEDAQNRTIATVFVPDDKIRIFIKRIESYRDYDPEAPSGREYRDLVQSISAIRLATLRELWTDDPALYPSPGTTIAWEVWLRRPDGDQPADGDPAAPLRAAADDVGYEVTSNTLKFVDRVVVLVRGTPEQLALGADILGTIAEVRRAKVSADFFSALTVEEQHEWSDALLDRITPPPADAPAVGLLDTGVTRGHPLLAPVITTDDVQTLKPPWGVHDTWPSGHGTPMAGLALYGDLTPLLAGNAPVTLTHGLQSLKLIHDPDPHRPDLYGTVTVEGVARLEIDADRRRVYCMAITADARDQGKPTSWSAAIDNLACGAINETRRLIILAAGNTSLDARSTYPASNETASIQDPAQAWNALTVGGYTEKAIVNQAESPGWSPLALPGDLAPSSTTSMTWPLSPKPPIKPDIVMEAGNMARHPTEPSPDYKPELLLVTTNHQFTTGHRPLTTFQDTSAGSALAANLAAQLMARYPDFTPETLRALLVHSARWTHAMTARATDAQGNVDLHRLLSTFGYGVPDEQDLFTSANNSLTLIAQDSLQPFFKDGSDYKTRDINYHELPWPRQALLDLPLDTPVQMRVTLSYFVEPSPGQRGWDKKYGYASHGLRFRVIRPTESFAEFQQRINTHGRDDDYEPYSPDETGTWTLGLNKPTNGSIHSNLWTGTAAQLANRRYIAIHPTNGWWRTRPRENRYDSEAPYSLIVTLSTPDQTVDIYTPVANQIGIAVPVFV
jgi:Subtilase family